MKDNELWWAVIAGEGKLLLSVLSEQENARTAKSRAISRNYEAYLEPMSTRELNTRYPEWRTKAGNTLQNLRTALPKHPSIL